MREYIIFTDSACDIPGEKLEKADIRSLALSFRFSGEERVYENYDIRPEVFFARMRAGETADTGGVNHQTFYGAFRTALEQLARLVKEKNSRADIRIFTIGTVIGAHSGPGTLAIFFLGKRRQRHR